MHPVRQADVDLTKDTPSLPCEAQREAEDQAREWATGILYPKHHKNRALDQAIVSFSASRTGIDITGVTPESIQAAMCEGRNEYVTAALTNLTTMTLILVVARLQGRPRNPHAGDGRALAAA